MPECLSSKARCVIRALLRKHPEERISSEDLLHHPWLTKENFRETVRSCSDQMVPMFVPKRAVGGGARGDESEADEMDEEQQRQQEQQEEQENHEEEDREVEDMDVPRSVQEVVVRATAAAEEGDMRRGGGDVGVPVLGVSALSSARFGAGGADHSTLMATTGASPAVGAPSATSFMEWLRG